MRTPNRISVRNRVSGMGEWGMGYRYRYRYRASVGLKLLCIDNVRSSGGCTGGWWVMLILLNAKLFIDFI